MPNDKKIHTKHPVDLADYYEWFLTTLNVIRRLDIFVFKYKGNRIAT